MSGRGRQIVLTLLLGTLPAGLLVLTLWAYDILVERMRVGLHDARSHTLRTLQFPSGASTNSNASASANLNANSTATAAATATATPATATATVTTTTTATTTAIAMATATATATTMGMLTASEGREASCAISGGDVGKTPFIHEPFRVNASSSGYPTAFLPDAVASLTVLSGEWPAFLDVQTLRGFSSSLGSSAENGVSIDGKGLEPSFLWIIPVAGGSRIAVQSRRQFYGRLESLRALIWIGGLLLVGGAFVMIVMVSRKLSDVFSEMEAKNIELERANRHLEDLGTLKSNFLALVSHELRTPLARLSGQVNLIRPSMEMLPGDLRGRFEQMALDVEELNRMTKNVLDLTRLQSEDLAARIGLAQIGPLIRGCVERIRSFAESRGIVVTIDLPEAPPVAHDAYLLERILDNLLINAVKYSPESGWINVALAEGTTTLDVRVESSGPVVITADRDRIFEKFYRVEGGADVPGTGLGLYLVRQFMLMMKGRAWVEPIPGGNRFAVTLTLS
ncbi:MAG: HAMP domain-containing sensor histidine kinase [Candidatus Ozemobacteraceae bacterium]